MEDDYDEETHSGILRAFEEEFRRLAPDRFWIPWLNTQFSGAFPATAFSMRRKNSAVGFCVQLDAEDTQDSFWDEVGSSTDEPIQNLVIRCPYWDVAFAITEMGRFVREYERD